MPLIPDVTIRIEGTHAVVALIREYGIVRAADKAGIDFTRLSKWLSGSTDGRPNSLPFESAQRVAAVVGLELSFEMKERRKKARAAYTRKPSVGNGLDVTA